MLKITDEIHNSEIFCKNYTVNKCFNHRNVLMTISVFLIHIFIFFLNQNSFGQSLKLSEVKGSLAHASLELAMQQKMDTIYIDKIDGSWVFGPNSFNNISNKVLIFEEGVEINAKYGVFEKGDALFEFVNCRNIEIIGKNNVICMNKEEYVLGEWRHIFSFRGCDTFKLTNLILKDSGGDGIYLAGSKEIGFCSNFIIDSITSTNNKRQGMSVISAKNLKVKNSIFKNTIGTLPEAGLDIEPNTSSDVIEDILFENCEFLNNGHAGILLALTKLNSNSKPVSIKFLNCRLSKNHRKENKYIASEIVINAAKEKPVEGLVTFSNCLVKDSQWGLFYSRKTVESFHVRFENCTAENICLDNSYPPIYLEVPDYKAGSYTMGGFTFDNLHLSYDTQVPLFLVRGSKLKTLKSLSSINGTILAKNKNGVEKINAKFLNYDPNNNVDFNLDIIEIHQ